VKSEGGGTEGSVKAGGGYRVKSEGEGVQRAVWRGGGV
jgi:hypothetical protein